MASLKFFYDNLWDDYTALTTYTEHANFPKENTQLRDFNKTWRSQYGTGTGWGYFNIIAATNDRIDFDEGGGEITANLTPGTYDVDTLCAHLKTIMDAAGAHTYTWEYIESGADINKFKCTDGTGNVAFPWNTGTNAARSVGDTIGFDVTADDGAAAAHTADDIRIHTAEFMKIDLGSAQAITAFIIKNHNFQSGSTIYIQANAADAWGAPTLNEAFTWGGDPDINADFAIKTWSSAQSFQWWRILIVDVDNSDGYVEMGRVFLCGEFQPTKHFAYKRAITQNDPSAIKESEDGQVTSIQRSHFQAWQYRFNGTDQKSSFDAMFDDRGFSKSLFICEDPDTPLITTFYVMFRAWTWEHLFDSYYNLSLAVREER